MTDDVNYWMVDNGKPWTYVEDEVGGGVGAHVFLYLPNSLKNPIIKPKYVKKIIGARLSLDPGSAPEM